MLIIKKNLDFRAFIIDSKQGLYIWLYGLLYNAEWFLNVVTVSEWVSEWDRECESVFLQMLEQQTVTALEKMFMVTKRRLLIWTRRDTTSQSS